MVEDIEWKSNRAIQASNIWSCKMVLSTLHNDYDFQMTRYFLFVLSSWIGCFIVVLMIPDKLVAEMKMSQKSNQF